MYIVVKDRENLRREGGGVVRGEQGKFHELGRYVMAIKDRGIFNISILDVNF